MLFGCYLIFVYFITCTNANKYYMKPNFPNYCKMKDTCKQVCKCEVYPNCNLLPMDENVRKTILSYHNQIRDIQSAAEPQPRGLVMLQYDMQLEEISKCWAARCENEHSDCFQTFKFRETSQSFGGLILEKKESPNLFFWLQMMSHWLAQAADMKPQTFHKLPSDEKSNSLHNFAQVMSDKVSHIGCAWSILSSDNWLMFVCTYGPRGPNQGEPIYKTGYACSSCPENYVCDYTKPFERLCKPKNRNHHEQTSSSMRSTPPETPRRLHTKNSFRKQFRIPLHPRFPDQLDPPKLPQVPIIKSPTPPKVPPRRKFQSTTISSRTIQPTKQIRPYTKKPILSHFTLFPIREYSRNGNRHSSLDHVVKSSTLVILSSFIVNFIINLFLF